MSRVRLFLVGDPEAPKDVPLLRPSSLLVALLALLVAASTLRFGGPHWTLNPNATDHLRHEYAAWAFLQEGFRIFSTPIAEWSVTAAHPHVTWEAFPEVYPPGLVLFFLPFGTISNLGLVPDKVVHILMVMTLAGGAVVASFQLLRTLSLRYEWTLAVLLAVFGTVLYVRFGANGFFDPIAAGVALAGIYWIDRGAYGRALIALATAFSLHFRLFYLWPIAIALVLRRWREMRPWQLALSTVLAVLALGAFVLAAPAVSGLDRIRGVSPNPLALTDGVTSHKLLVLVLALGLLLLVHVTERQLAVTASVALALVLIFGVAQWQAWYPVLMSPILALARTRWAQVGLAVGFAEIGGFTDLAKTLSLFARQIV